MRGVTGALIFANLFVFALQVLYGDALIVPFALWPMGDQLAPQLGATIGFRAWQLVTYAFLHGNGTHLFLNMFALWMFGRDCEAVLGSQRFLAMYAAAVLTAALVQLAVSSASGDSYPTVGASGGVFGVLLAFALLYPRRRVLLLIPPIPMPAWLFVTLYGVIELASGVLGTAAGIAHFAHLGGMAGAYLVLRSWRGHVA
jgi:membrane associated rhomboid family serine protease